MNPFESALAAALEAEVQETAMSVNTDRGADELNDRMDSADRSKRQRTWLVAAAAVVVVMVAGAAFAGSRTGGEAQQVPGAGPSPQTSAAPSPTAGEFTSTEFADPFSVTLPPWVTEVMSEPTSQTPEWVTWNRCDTDSTCIGLSFDQFSRYYAPGKTTATPIKDYAGYVSYLKSLGDSGDLVVSKVSKTEIGGRPATLLTVTARTGTSVIGALGCYIGGTQGSGDCWDFGDNYPTRLAIVDTGDQPLVILTRTATDNPSGADWTAQVESMLSTIQFG